jgi:hypothetical protein
MSRKLQEKQDRRLADKRRREAARRASRRSNLVTVAVGVVVALVVAAFIYQDRRAEEAPVGVSSAAANCSPVETHPEEGQDHVPDGTSVDYATTPPTSGNHYQDPADPGFFASPVPEETLVHNLEHGQIVIWYRPDAPESTLDDLGGIVDQQPVATLAVPYDAVEDPYTFTLTAWGASMSCEAVSQDAIDRFRARFQGRGPEQVGIPPFEASD